MALQLTCEALDVCYNSEALEQAKSHLEKLLNQGKKAEAFFGYYKSKLGSTGKNNAGLASFRYKDSDNINHINMDISNVKNSDLSITEDEISFWGNNFSPEEYAYLTNKLSEYLNTYECETPAMEELLKQAAFESLEIRNRRQRREDVSKNLKNLQDLLGSANIKPNQESGANSTEQASFGLLIKKWETEEPIPEPDEEWKDVDGIGRYIRIWFLGHLCKMMGITNDYSKEYEEEMAKLRVEIPSENIDMDMDEGD
jgi:chromosome segregation ATPase